MSPEPTERRRQPRTNLSQVVKIRPSYSRSAPDACTTLNVSRDGLYIATSAGSYAAGMNMYLMPDYQFGSPFNYGMAGVVVRVERLEDDTWGVAIHNTSNSPWITYRCYC